MTTPTTSSTSRASSSSPVSPGATGLHIDGQNAFHIDRGGRVVQIRQSTRADGSLALSDPDTPRHRRALADLPWTTLQQVHGAEVIAVDAPGARCGEAGDALITCEVDAVVAVQTADCVPIALIATDADGVPVGVGVVHAGWRGLLSGVVEASTAKLRARARAAALTAVIGAHIHACCYRFEVDDAAPLVGRYGVGARADAGQCGPPYHLGDLAHSGA